MGGPQIGYDESVEQALCFGWVDSRDRTLDDRRTMLWFAPRKARSGWARSNKERIERLTAAGLMEPAGLALVEAAKADGSWTLLDAVEDLVVPDDLAAALDSAPPARAHWEAFPRSVRRSILEWIVHARRPETRARRVAVTAELASRNERANQWALARKHALGPEARAEGPRRAVASRGWSSTTRGARSRCPARCAGWSASSPR